MSQESTAPAAPNRRQTRPQNLRVKERWFVCFVWRYWALNVMIVAGVWYGVEYILAARDAGESDPTNSLLTWLLPAILLIHVFSTYWLYIWWPWRGTSDGEAVVLGSGFFGTVFLGVLCYFFWSCIYSLKHDPAPMISPLVYLYALAAWLIVIVCITVFIWLHRIFLDPDVEACTKAKKQAKHERRFAKAKDRQEKREARAKAATEAKLAKADAAQARLEDKKEWARKFLHENYAPHADLVAAHYTEADLERDFLRTIGRVRRPWRIGAIPRYANRIVAKIDRYRAFETVRRAHFDQSQREGGTFPWTHIVKDAKRLLRWRRSLSKTRQLEAELLARIEKLSHWHRNQSQQGTNDEQPSAQNVAAAIAREVRSEASPSDSEQDIQREIAHRLRGFEESVTV